jgi:hypothetical protein
VAFSHVTRRDHLLQVELLLEHPQDPIVDLAGPVHAWRFLTSRIDRGQYGAEVLRLNWVVRRAIGGVLPQRRSPMH